MPLEPAITDLEQLKDRPAVAALEAGLPGALQAAKFDRSELTLWIDPLKIIPALTLLRDSAATSYKSLADVTAVDWLPAEPRFEVVYSLLSYERRERLRVKVKVSGNDPYIESATVLWPGASPFEREIFDLFGIRFLGHPDLRRILLPDDWEGHPLRKDYPVEGYR
ncbi:MAG: NADH-quinone oxidoreductase subunit C [Acidobacteriota bacterium]|nr:NADH-quinone oxidoreductase subunit C [Acidobacteriota bacterium]